jgi:hypothetical protein
MRELEGATFATRRRKNVIVVTAGLLPGEDRLRRRRQCNYARLAGPPAGLVLSSRERDPALLDVAPSQAGRFAAPASSESDKADRVGRWRPDLALAFHPLERLE